MYEGVTQVMHETGPIPNLEETRPRRLVLAFPPMRATIFCAAVLALASLSACGGEGSSDVGAAPEDTVAPLTETPSTTGAPTTEAPTTTTPAVCTPGSTRGFWENRQRCVDGRWERDPEERPPETTAPLPALRYEWPAAFNIGGDPCPPEGGEGFLSVSDVDDESRVVEVPTFCDGGVWYIEVAQAPTRDTALAALGCAEEMRDMTLDVVLTGRVDDAMCDQAENLLQLEVEDPAAFLMRRQLQATRSSVAAIGVQKILDGTSPADAEQRIDAAFALADMLEEYAALS